MPTGWHEVGSLRLASSPERMEELARQAGWAKTFGLPLELISAGEALDAVPADVDRRRAGRGVPARPTATSIPASSRSPSPRGPAAGGRRSTPTPGSPGIDVAPGPRVAAFEPTGATCDTEVVVNAGGMFAGEIGRDGRGERADRPHGPRVPDHEAGAGFRRTSRPCATRRCWCTSGARSAASWPADTSATRCRGGSTASLPTSTTGCCPRTGDRSSR